MIRFLVLAGYFWIDCLSPSVRKIKPVTSTCTIPIWPIFPWCFPLSWLLFNCISGWSKSKPTVIWTADWRRLLVFALLAIPLVVGLTFPTVSLDSQTVSAKGYHFPLSKATDQTIQTSEGTTSQYLKPDTSSYFSKQPMKRKCGTAADKYLSQDSIQITNENYMEVMEAIYDYQMSLRVRQFSSQALSITTPVMLIANFVPLWHYSLYRRFRCLWITDKGGIPVSIGEHLDNNHRGNWSITTIKNSKPKPPKLWKSKVLPKSDKQKNPYVYRVFLKSKLNPLKTKREQVLRLPKKACSFLLYETGNINFKSYTISNNTTSLVRPAGQ